MTGKDATDSGSPTGNTSPSSSQPTDQAAENVSSADDAPRLSVISGTDDDEATDADLSGVPGDDTTDADSSSGPADWTGEEFELDRLYQEAVEAMEEVEWEHGAPPVSDDASTAGSDDADRSGDGRDGEPASTGIDDSEPEDPTAELHARVKPGQVIEAALFVGGGPLPSRKLAWLLGGSCEPDSVVRMIDELNDQYSDQQRPYEIRLGEGGYHLALKSDYEPLWHRVFGLGPKEIKLSQEALEVLALVAYQQPVSPEKIDDLSKRRAGGVLRQLVRRQLLEIERGETRKDITYRTTARFLEVFGIRSLDELPRAESLTYK